MIEIENQNLDNGLEMRSPVVGEEVSSTSSSRDDDCTSSAAPSSSSSSSSRDQAAEASSSSVSRRRSRHHHLLRGDQKHREGRSRDGKRRSKTYFGAFGETINSGIGEFFKIHGEFCASQPWEVIVVTFMFLVFVMTICGKQASQGAAAECQAAAEAANHNKNLNGFSDSECGEETAAIHTRQQMSWTQAGLIITFGCLSIMRSTYQFKKIHSTRSDVIWKIALAYLAFTSFLFAIVIWSIGPALMRNLQESWFFVPMLIDMQKVTRVTQFVLSSSHYRRVSENLANAMQLLAPQFTLDTVCKGLFASIGFHSGIPELESYSWYATVAIFVNYLNYVTFFPAGLALMLELMYCKDGRPTWDVRRVIKSLPKEERTISSMAHRIKVGMATILVLAHIFAKPLFSACARIANWKIAESHLNPSEHSESSDNIWRMVMAFLTIAISAKYLLDEIESEQSRNGDSSSSEKNSSERDQKSFEKLERKFAGDGRAENDQLKQQEAEEEEERLQRARLQQRIIRGAAGEEYERGSDDCTDEGISVGGSTRSSTNKRPIFEVCGDEDGGDSSSESAWSVVGVLPDYRDQSAQTSAKSRQQQHQLSPDLSIMNTQPSNSTAANSSSNSSSTVEGEPTSEAKTIRSENDENDTSCEDSEDEEDVTESGTQLRSLEGCTTISKTPGGLKTLTNLEIVELLKAKIVRGHSLESSLGNNKRAVRVRRAFVSGQSRVGINGLPHKNYNYDLVIGACCESVIGYMTVPVGVVGPLLLDGQTFQVPMATTEGCLVASVNRGCRALVDGKGVTSVVYQDGMSRGPVVRFPDITKMAEAMEWLRDPTGFDKVKSDFDSTSRFARLQSLKLKPAGCDLFIRFVAKTGDAMGMNMISKATEHALHKLGDVFPDMEIVSVSGNFCTDKKPAAVNWIDGRGKSVVAEAVIPKETVSKILKTTPAALAKLNYSKNLIGSAMAGSVGGFNAQASNVVTAIFLATGQDAAQNVASSQCLTRMEETKDGNGDLYVSCTMPSIEVGTVGGGTILEAQGACLEMLGLKGSHPTTPGDNAKQLARVICAAVLAGEVSLMSALAEGHLVRSHMRHNRSKIAISNAGASLPASTPQAPHLPPCSNF